MLCEKCNKNQATFHYAEVINGVRSEHHLCSECAANTDVSFYSSIFENDENFTRLISGILGGKAIVSGNGESDKETTGETIDNTAAADTETESETETGTESETETETGSSASSGSESDSTSSESEDKTDSTSSGNKESEESITSDDKDDGGSISSADEGVTDKNNESCMSAISAGTILFNAGIIIAAVCLFFKKHRQ